MLKSKRKIRETVISDMIVADNAAIATYTGAECLFKKVIWA